MYIVRHTTRGMPEIVGDYINISLSTLTGPQRLGTHYHIDLG